ncbi:hypothetical protein IJE86_00385 [bacterium]|nr:hypothetical protein [bacterium]
MNQNFSEDAYIIDLSYATSASDIVFELSSVIDNERAKNQNIALKLGKVDLNQSQLLSIRSLINSINSTVTFLETNSAQTELAAINLGIVVSSVKTTEKTEDTTNLAEPTLVPSYEYVKLEDHIDENEDSKDDESDVVEDTDESQEDAAESEDTQSEVSDEESALKEEKNNSPIISNDEADEIIVAKSEDIQNALDNIYSTEVKLESILDGEVSNEDGVISAAVVKKAVMNEAKYTEEDFEIDHFSTSYVKQTLRSGQIVNYDGNVVIIGDCHPGSEVIASGDITVWGILSGIAHAGVKGNERAKVRALKMNAIQLRIAKHYARKPDGMNTIFPERTSTFTPEEARVVDNEIVIFKIND